MTLQDIVLSPLMVGEYIAAILLLFTQIYIFIISSRFALGAKYKAFAVCHGAVWFILISLLLDRIYALDYLPYERGYISVVALVYRLPWAVLLSLEIIGAALSVTVIMRAVSAGRRRASPYSVKQTIDFLPVGICVGRADGSVLLSNIKMNEISEILTGSPVSDFGVLLSEVEGGTVQSDGRTLVLKDPHAFVFETSDLSIGGAIHVQLVAEDQTEQYLVTRELSEKQKELRDLQVRLKAYRVREDELITRQEILEARKTVHTQLGGALLTGKYYFEHPENVDEAELLELMRRINTYLLGEVEEPEGERDEYSAALKMADRIGVALEINGKAPDDPTIRNVVGQAIGECAANAVKHAAGDKVFVKFSSDRVVITNNGEIPKKTVAESGGLLPLRRAAEACGIEMTVRSEPEFSLTLSYGERA